MINPICISKSGIIKKLDEDVINKIAAGEVIQRPYNALKELIENSIDAKSMAIQISIKDGGMKCIHIQDNGTGIHKDDLGIICERFTTSKICKYDDLNSLQTYGFRGEALASISHVSHLYIITKMANSACAYKCSYLDGKPKDTPKPFAGNQGTQIIIEDLFYNLPIRRKALKSYSHEYAKICDIVMKYAVHNYGLAFSLKKQNSQIANIRTYPSLTPIDAIRNLYGHIVAQDLIQITHSDPTGYRFELVAYLTNPAVNKFNKQNINKLINLKNNASVTALDYNLPTTSSKFLLFINNRCVNCVELKKALDSVYQECVGDKYSKYNLTDVDCDKQERALNYFAYIDLKIDPQNIDVNLHPTKSQVCFLHQDKIISVIKKIVEKQFFPEDLKIESSKILKSCSALKLKSPDDSMPNKNDSLLKDYGFKSISNSSTLISEESINMPTSVNNHSNKYLNRTDHTSQKLDFFLRPKDSPIPTLSDDNNNQPKKDTDASELISMKRLKNEIIEMADWQLTKLIREHVYIGCVNAQNSLIQHNTGLYLANNRKLAKELYYQLLIKKFGRLSTLKASPGKNGEVRKASFNIFTLALTALQNEAKSGWEPSHGSKQKLAQFVQDLLASKADMLEEYFSFRISRYKKTYGK
ncbi:unnamed protein product [Gordionus sp. m RMFG-2023]